jgi:hypothetical protein
MVINAKIRKNLIDLLPKNYRQIIAEQVGCHPNTVYNVLHHEHPNLDVALALLQLGKDQKEAKAKEEVDHKKALSIAKQLSAG